MKIVGVCLCLVLSFACKKDEEGVPQPEQHICTSLGFSERHANCVFLGLEEGLWAAQSFRAQAERKVLKAPRIGPLQNDYSQRRQTYSTRW